MKRLKHMIFRVLMVLVPWLLGLNSVRAQADTVCVNETSVWVVEESPGVSHYWELYNDVTGINFVTDPGNCPPTEAYFVGGVNAGDSVNVMGLRPGTYFIKVRASNSCTDNIKVGKIVVVPCMSTAVLLEPAPVCEGDTALFTFEITGGIGPWSITYTDGITEWTIEDIPSSPHIFQHIPTPTVPGTYQYWITRVVNGAGYVWEAPGDPVNLIVKPRPVTSPIFRY